MFIAKGKKISAKIKLAEHFSPSNAALAAHPKFFLTISPLADLAVGSAMIGMLGCFWGAAVRDLSSPFDFWRLSDLELSLFHCSNLLTIPIASMGRKVYCPTNLP